MLSLIWLLAVSVVAAERIGPPRHPDEGAAAAATSAGAGMTDAQTSKLGPASKIPPGGAATPTAGRADARRAVAPSVAFSQYIKTTRTKVLDRLGCAEGHRLGRSKQASAIAVLAFGRPMRRHGRAGASLFGVRFASTVEIERAAEAYARGYLRCTEKGAPRLHVAIGTSNFGPGVNFSHGAAWARMVNRANDWVFADGNEARVEFAGGNDIELSWNGPVASRAWVRGYDSRAKWPFYDFGDAAACPPRGNCAGSWTQEDVWYVAWGAHSAWPLPQIYTPSGTMAQEWYQLSLYSFRHHGWRMTIVGVLSQRTACRQSSDPCLGMNNSPSRAWNQLNGLLNGDPRTAQPLRWLADFRWAEER